MHGGGRAIARGPAKAAGSLFSQATRTCAWPLTLADDTLWYIHERKKSSFTNWIAKFAFGFGYIRLAHQCKGLFLAYIRCAWYYLKQLFQIAMARWGSLSDCLHRQIKADLMHAHGFSSSTFTVG